jgi:hypothetical protein
LDFVQELLRALVTLVERVQLSINLSGPPQRTENQESDEQQQGAESGGQNRPGAGPHKERHDL